jgi:putative endonuclease
MVTLGDKGEGFAAGFLRKKGYKILEQNYKTRIGEIDIIAMDGETLVFVEVKTRESLNYGRPFESVTVYKRKKISNVAMLYLKRLKSVPPCRFDVVSIYHEQGRSDFELIQDAFET